MAMNLFCYSSKSPSALQEIVDFIVNQHKEIFEKRFLVSSVRVANSVHKEIALDYGFHANSFFLVNYNDKSGFIPSSTVVDLIKKSIGINDVLVLFENEELK